MYRTIISLLLLLIAISDSLADETTGIGVGKLPQHYKSDEKISRLIRDLTMRPLLTKKQGQFYPAAAKSVEPGKESITIYLDQKRKFTSGERITPEDISYSLGYCQPVCSESVSFSVVDPFYRVNVDCGKEAKNSCCDSLLTECPMLHKEVSIRFSDTLLTGTNLVSTGPYMIASHDPGKKLLLSRFRGFWQQMDGAPERIQIQVLNSTEEGLRLLRRGVLAAIVIEADENIEQRVKQDSTLRSISCDSLKIIHRHSIAVHCAPFFGLEVLKRDLKEKASYDTRKVISENSNSKRNAVSVPAFRVQQ